MILHVNRLACHPGVDNFKGVWDPGVRIVLRAASELTRRVYNSTHRCAKEAGDLQGCAFFLFFDIASCYASIYAFIELSISLTSRTHLFSDNDYRLFSANQSNCGGLFRGVFWELSST